MVNNYRRSIQNCVARAGAARATVDRPDSGKRTLSETLLGESSTTSQTPVQRQAAGPASSGNVHETASHGIADGGARLPYFDRIQRLFGAHDVSNVKAHIGGRAAHACQDMGAVAYATGDHVAFSKAPDLHTAAHEAAHVVQQKAGVQLAGAIGQAGDEYERNADQVADAIVAGRSAEALLSKFAPNNQPTGQSEITDRMAASSAVQRRALESEMASETKIAVGGKQHTPCAECGSDDCECPKPSGQPVHGKKDAKSHENEAEPYTKGSIPRELLRYILQSGITSPSQMSRDQVLQIGQLARSRMPEHEIAEVGQRSGVNLPAQGDAKQAGGTGQPVQRQVPLPNAMQAAGQAAAATAGTMWWLTVVDGPLPVGDILYGILIAGAAVAAAVTAGSAMQQVCSRHLTECLENPWQPEWNRERFGARKDCGACYRECMHAVGIWPNYKCPL